MTSAAAGEPAGAFDDDGLLEEVGRLQAMLEHTTDIITVLDATGAVRYSNAAAGHITGLAGENVAGTSAFDFIHPDDRDVAVAVFTTALEHPRITAAAEVRLPFADGEWHTCEVRLNNRLDDTSVEGIVATLTDVTERNRDRARVARSEERLRALVENLTDVIVVLDRHFDVTFVSRSIERIIGAPADTNLGMSAFNDIHPDDLPAAREMLEGLAAAALGANDMIELRLESRPGSGDWRWIQVVAVNRLDDPSIEGIVCTLRDITDARHAADRLREALDRERSAVERLRELDRMKDEFLSTVTHELRTPLTSIGGFASVLLSGSVTDEMRQTILERISANAEDMAAMVERLLDFSRLQAGRVVVDQSTLHLAAAVVSAVDALGHHLDGHAVEVDVDSSLTVVGDRVAVGHVLRNLLTNAAKYSPPGTPITVSAMKVGDHVEVSVADRGEGIPADLHQRVFERFYRGPTAPHGGRRGSGIGLSVVQRYVELMGGTIRLTSEPSLGSTFTFTLPSPAASAG